MQEVALIFLVRISERKPSMKTSEVELRALMKASLEGDAAAYRTLLVDVTPHLRAYFKNRLGASRQSATQVENLVQAALITIHHRRHTYASQRALIPWICAIARYRLLSHLRETRGSLAGVSVDDACDLPDGDERVAESS